MLPTARVPLIQNSDLSLMGIDQCPEWTLWCGRSTTHALRRRKSMGKKQGCLSYRLIHAVPSFRARAFLFRALMRLGWI